MATVLSTLYPPLIDTFMPAFPNTQMAEANFSISPYNSSYDIHYLHVTLVDQRTNKNAFATDANVDTPAGTALINGVWIIPFNELLNGNINSFLDLNREANRYTLYIPPSLLKQNEINERTFVVNSYYKLQIRFDKNNDPNLSLSAINSDYLSTKRAYFSEWSSVCLLKAIPEITVHFNNFTPELDDYLKQTNTSITNLPSDFVVPVREPQYIPGLIPFAGNLTFAGFDDAGLNKSASTEYYQRDIKTTSNSEYLMSYRIVVTNQKNVVLRDSGVQYPSRTEKTNNFYWLCDMTLTSKSSDEEESEEDASITLSDDYTVTLTFTTNNQYTFSKSFKFTLVDSLVDNFHPNFYFLNKRMLPYYGQGYIFETDNEVAKENKKVLVTSEDGMVELKITSTESRLSPGYLFIKRASALDNFQNWQVLDCYFTSSGVFERTIVDNTLSSLTEYKYACQFLTIKGNWSKNVVYDSTIYPDFHDILISRGNRQLAIRYNAQITSMTPIVSRVKIDTLGGRYPKFAENAKIHYKQFQLNGLIIAESDYNRKFLSELDFSKEMSAYDKHMDGKYMVRNDTVIESKQAYLDFADVTNHDVYPTDNWWWERKFREEAIEWLNDGEPKLYRSMTEGNLIVMIDGISLTPNPQLGRRIWNFSATLYEVGDGNSLEQLDALGIYDIANVHDENLTKLIEGESGDLPYEEHRHLGQSFSVTAKDVSQSTTKIVNIEKTNDRHAIVPIESNYLEIPNKKDKTWAETMTVGEKIQFWYEGMHRDFDPSSVRLRDVKIQFESLPQWYDLNALTPEGTNPYAIGLTMSVWNSTLGEWEEKTGRAYYTKDTKGEWVLTWEPIEGWNEPLWNKAGKSITDFINDWEEACGNLYKKIYLSEDTKETVYIGTAAAETDYYKLKSKIDDKEFLLRTDVWNSLLQKENEEWKLPLSIKDDTSLNGLYYTTKKKEDELNINSYVFLEKDLLEGDGNIVYKKNEEPSIVYENNIQETQNSNYYRLLNNNNKEYYIGKNEEGVQAFYPINKSYEYLKIDSNDPVQKYIVDNSLYRKIGIDCTIKNLFNSINDDNTISVGKKDLQQLDNLFSYKITFTSKKNNKNGINIFNNYYNSKITTNEEVLQLDNSLIESNSLEWRISNEPAENQENPANEPNENQENSTDTGFTTIKGIIRFQTEHIKSDDWWILTDDKIYKNIIWEEEFEYDKKLTLENSQYKKQNINIVSKNLQEIFKYWVTNKEDKEIEIYSYLENITNIENLINDNNIIEITIKPKFENKIPIEQKLYLSSVNNEYELSFSLKRGESIEIYNLPNKDIISWKVSSENKTLKDDNHPNIYIDTNSCENTSFSGNYIIGQDKSGSTVETIYVLQKKDEKIDLMRVARNEKDIIFSNIPSFDSEAEYVVKRLNDNVERDVNNNTNSFYNFDKKITAENDKLRIDISEDYVLNTDLSEKDNNTYYWGEKEIQTQDSNGEWIWTRKKMFLPYTSEQEGEEKYIKYKSIYLSISDIQQYPYFYLNDNNYLKIHNYEEIYYYEDLNIILQQPNIHYLQIFARNDILEADRTQTDPKPHYVRVSDWKDSEKWIEKCHYNDSLDPHINLYDGQSYQGENLYSEWEWWDKNNIIQSKIYKNKNDKSSPVPMFEETTDDTDAYYKTTIKWKGYPTDNYYPLEDFFEPRNEDETDKTISSLKKYVFVGNRSKYLPKDFIVTGNDAIASGPGNELIRVNLDTGQDWNITSSNDDKPGIIDAVKEFLEEAVDKQQKIVSKNYGLGYKLRLILTSPYDPTVTLRRTIFVNDRGYYQVPSNLIVKDIGLFDGARATIDYILEYELKYSDDSEPNSYEVAENVVGQVSGEWDFSTSIAPMIQSKYWAYDKDESGYTTTQQSVDYWRATSYDGVPYTRLLMKSTGLTESAEYIVSRSGVLNLETDYPTEGLIIAGKRMVEAPKDRQKFLDEWEYVLDESVFVHGGSEDEGMIHWWVVHPYEDEMPGLDWEDWMESDVLVKISLSENFEMRDIANWWYQISDVFPPEGQPEIQIINPQYNTIYAIVTPGGIEYKIYYLNQGWYPVEFLKNNDNETDYSFCNAKVPVSGTINYRASILKKLWINE